MDKIIKKSELKKQMRMLDNAIDRFLIVGLFYGLDGENNGGSQIAGIKKSNIDFENKKIILDNGFIFDVDEYLEKIVRDAINQSVYLKLGNDVDGRSSADYEFNMNSEYIIKTIPNKRTDNGLNPLTSVGVRQKVRRIGDFIGVKYNKNTIRKSTAYNLLDEANKPWKIIEAEEFLKARNMGIRRNNLIPMLNEINEKY